MKTSKKIFLISGIAIISMLSLFGCSQETKTPSESRKELERFECGFPNKQDVKAVVYSNGELVFEGSGDVQQYDHNKHPWQMSKNKITSISFEKDVTPTYMDYWFENMKDVKKIGKLPQSVKSVAGMCLNCSALETPVDWADAKEITDISKVYMNCSSLEQVKGIPSKTANASFAFAGCVKLQKAPDMEDAKKLKNAIGMFSNCLELKEGSYVPNVELMDMMYDSCSKLKKMPKISEKAISLSYTFRNCTSLENTEKIPESAQNITGCFEGCKKLDGTLTVDSNAKEYKNFLHNTKKIKLNGKSKILKELENTFK